ncbi:MAG TPA: nuclear transport factor 2 family protein [Ktedonobacterales bacterium]|nr:nuclear transport factor 2 family protein [Ktedonobacterales bacterium]
MSSDYSGGQPPHYPQGRSRDSQGGSERARGYPNNRGNLDNSPPARPARQQRADYPQGGPGSRPHSSPSGSGRGAPDAWEQGERSRATSPNRPPWLVPVIAVALLIVVCGAVVGVVYAIGQNALQEPMNTAKTFCNDLKAQKYSDAYSLLSSEYQGRVSGKDFADASQVHDQLDGKARQCGLTGFPGNGGFNLNLNPQDASFDAQIIRNRTYTGAITLVKQNGSWKIDAVADSLQGSDVGALTTAGLFCKALASQNYTDVYGMFTPAYQQQIGSAESYANGLKKVFGGGQFQITGCQPQLTTFSIIPQGDSASVSGAFNIKVTTEAGALTVPVPFKMTFARISGAWKISDLQVVQSQG